MADVLPYGFKAEAERIALAIRAELDVSPFEPLDCRKLAAHLAIPIITLDDLAGEVEHSESITHFARQDAGFSALTVCLGTKRIIVYNPRHSHRRQASSLAHELAHVILEHPPSAVLGDGRCRYWDQSLETQADWLGSALLVPRDGLLRWVSKRRGLVGAESYFGVSSQLLKWRFNQTGIKKQISRWS